MRRKKSAKGKKKVRRREPLAVSFARRKRDREQLADYLSQPLSSSRACSLFPIPLSRTTRTHLLELSAELLGDDRADVGEDLFFVLKKRKLNSAIVSDSFSSYVCGRRSLVFFSLLLFFLFALVPPSFRLKTNHSPTPCRRPGRRRRGTRVGAGGPRGGSAVIAFGGEEKN